MLTVFLEVEVQRLKRRVAELEAEQPSPDEPRVLRRVVIHAHPDHVSLLAGAENGSAPEVDIKMSSDEAKLLAKKLQEAARGVLTKSRKKR